EGGQVEHGGVGPPDDGGHAGKAQRHAGGTAQQAGGGAVDHILGGDLAVGVAQGLEGAHLGAVFFHHTGHGGACHQGRHQEEEDGEHPGDGLDAVGVLLIEHDGDDAAPVQDIPFGGGDVVHLLGGVVQLLAGVGQLRFGAGLLLRKLGRAVVVLGPAFVQLGAGGFQDRKSTRLNSSHVSISYAVFCLEKK